MELCEMIYRRKSTRSYTGEPVDDETIQKIRAFSAGVKPLYPEIRMCAEIIGSENVKCILPWTTPQVIAVFSEEAKGAMENIGFCFQQLELYLQTLGLGACWLGMGRLDMKGNENLKQRDGMKFAMMIAFGYPKEKALPYESHRYGDCSGTPISVSSGHFLLFTGKADTDSQKLQLYRKFYIIRCRSIT